jgi:hypothetical protein
VARKESLTLLHKTYFGGGSVQDSTGGAGGCCKPLKLEVGTASSASACLTVWPLWLHAAVLLP